MGMKRPYTELTLLFTLLLDLTLTLSIDEPIGIDTCSHPLQTHQIPISFQNTAVNPITVQHKILTTFPIGSYKLKPSWVSKPVSHQMAGCSGFIRPDTKVLLHQIDPPPG